MRVRPVSKQERVEGQGGNVPPGQFVTEKFPVFTYGETPAIDLKTWSLRIFGCVEREVTLDWKRFTDLPQTAMTADLHCVTRWSRLGNLWEGVAFKEAVSPSRAKPEARYVTIHCYGGYTTSLPVDALMDDYAILARCHDGKPLSTDHGGPVRLVAPKRYGWKSAKWVNGLEFTVQDRLGFWERRGYNSNADPWKEERLWDGVNRTE